MPGGSRSGPTRRRGSPTTARASRRCTGRDRRRPAATTCRSSSPSPQGAPTGTVFNGGDRASRRRQPSRVPVLVGSRRDQRLEPGVRPPPRSTRRSRRGSRARSTRASRSPTPGRARACTRPTSTTPRSTCGTTRSPRPVGPAGSPIRNCRKGFAPFGIQTVGGKPRRHVRQAGRRRRGRRRRAGPRLRRRVRHRAATCCAASRPARPLNAPWGIALGTEGLRAGERRPAGRQLRRRPHQRVRPAARPVRGRAARQARPQRSRSTACGRSSSATA